MIFQMITLKNIFKILKKHKKISINFNSKILVMEQTSKNVCHMHIKIIIICRYDSWR